VIEVYIRSIQSKEAADLQRFGINAFGNGFRRGAAAAYIVFDTEIRIRASRIVACGKQNAPKAPRRRISADIAGVDRSPPRPTSMRPKPFAAAILTMLWIAVRL